MSYFFLVQLVLVQLVSSPLLLVLEQAGDSLPGGSLPNDSLIGLILRASPIAKLVLLLLLGLSIASWSIVFTKWRLTKRNRELATLFLQVFDKSTKWAELYANTASLSDNPIKSIFLAAHGELQKQKRLNTDAIQRVMQSASIDEATRMEQSLGVLASTASAAPFIGLFGTVVGIIIAFQGLSQATTSSIQAVAPGIAEALIATAAGIGAAVPAVLAYNHYVNLIKVMTAEMDSFSLRLLNLIEREADQVTRNV
ncbi:MAG: MotA/TolQ/ExbB proton channel family protein [Blastocatellia bacterium]|jgi:biopolymer transport protein TolQ